MASILVVDDSLFDLKRAAHLLQKKIPESTIFTAEDGQAAIEKIEQARPQVVVTDLQMPRMNGLDLVVETRNRFPNIPVILMTAAGSEKIAAEALMKGAASYVPKRELSVDLVPIVVRLLGRAREKSQQLALLNSLQEARFAFPNDRRLLTSFVQSLRESIESRQIFQENDCFRITTAVDEAISNAYFHGNLEVSSRLREEDIGAFENLAEERRREPPYCDRRIHVHILFDEGLTITIRDEGPGFDPVSLPDPFSDGFAERPCGRGVLLMRSFMDEVEFNEQGNEVTMVKRIEALTSTPS
ncbi:MAG: ATP-binding protein [Planctomycetaceae bacterium]|nr:ATP-binding protein [Planctomycetaceae bacterium]